VLPIKVKVKAPRGKKNVN